MSIAALKREVADIRASLNLSIGHRLNTVTAADFVTGGRPDFGRACSAKCEANRVSPMMPSWSAPGAVQLA